MVVKVVGQSDEVAKRVTCRNCGAILEYLPIDVKSRSYKDYDGGSDMTYWINCPTCNRDVIVRVG